MKILSRKEVLQHNTKTDCWIIVRNRVYDITGFIAAHPGGSDILLSRAGEDATSYFVVKHGLNPHVLKNLEKLEIGELPLSEQITTNDFNEPFLMELIDRCYKEKLYSTPVWYTNRLFWIRSINIVLVFHPFYHCTIW